jgi:hypothetical protein
MMDTPVGEGPSGKWMDYRLGGPKSQVFGPRIGTDQSNASDVIHQPDHEVPQDGAKAIQALPAYA